MAKLGVHQIIGVFLIIIGLLPFLRIGFGVLTDAIHVLTVISGIVILLTKR
jgi:hypothetical protein